MAKRFSVICLKFTEGRMKDGSTRNKKRNRSFRNKCLKERKKWKREKIRRDISMQSKYKSERDEMGENYSLKLKEYFFVTKWNDFYGFLWNFNAMHCCKHSYYKALHGAVMHLSFVIKIYLKIRKGYYTKKGLLFCSASAAVFIVFIKSKNSVKKNLLWCRNVM